MNIKKVRKVVSSRNEKFYRDKKGIVWRTIIIMVFMVIAILLIITFISKLGQGSFGFIERIKSMLG
jgi:hypothetical protein